MAETASFSESAPGEPGRAPPTHKEILVVIGALMLGMLLAALDQTIVATALPTIVSQLGGLTHLSWVVTAYMLASTVSTPIYGKLGDTFGRKRVYQVAITVFLAGSMLSGAARTMDQLIAFRGLQGLGAGGLMVTAQAMVADVVSPRERGRYQGYFGAVFGASSILGPFLGGFLTDHASWRWVFYVNLPIGVAALVAIAATIPGSGRPARAKPPTIDVVGTALLATSVASFVLITTGGAEALADPHMRGLAAVTAAMLVAFVLVERRAKEPVLPLALFRDATFDIASAVSFLIGFGMFGVISFLPLYLQTARGATATGSGMLLLPFMLGLLTASIVTGQIVSRTGKYKRFPLLGMALSTAGMLMLSRITPASPTSVATLDVVLLGAGIGLTMQVMVVATQNSIPRPMLGVATSSVTFFRSVGGSVGVAAFGALFNLRLSRALADVIPAEALATAHAKQLESGARGARALMAALPDALRPAYVDAFSLALTGTFLYAVPCFVLALILTAFLEEKPLRGREPAPATVAE